MLLKDIWEFNLKLILLCDVHGSGIDLIRTTRMLQQQRQALLTRIRKEKRSSSNLIAFRL